MQAAMVPSRARNFTTHNRTAAHTVVQHVTRVEVGMIYRAILAAGLVLAMTVTTDARYKGYSSRSYSKSYSPRPYYGGGRHTYSHGGSYSGGFGSSHRGGKYRNYSTGHRYGRHK